MLDQLLEDTSFCYLMGCSSVHERVFFQEAVREMLGKGDVKELLQSISVTARAVKTPADLDAAVKEFAAGWWPSDYGLPDWTIVASPVVGLTLGGKLASHLADLDYWRELALFYSQLSLELGPWAKSGQTQLHRHLMAKSGDWYGKQDYENRKQNAKGKIDADRGGIRR